MITGLIIFHVVVCILLVVVVLLQFGRGAEVGAVMGGSSGSSQAIFSSSAKGNFFTKMTTVLAILFMVNSITIATLQADQSKKSIFDDEAPIAQPLNRDAIDNQKMDDDSANNEVEKTEEASQ